jgi:hypothetical protein
MSRDGNPHVLRKIRIDGSRRIRRQHGNALGDFPSRGRGGADNCHRLCISLDNDLRTHLNVLQHGTNILSQIRLADVQYSRTHLDLLRPFGL